MGKELPRGQEKTRMKTAGAAAVGLRKKRTAADPFWVELETVRRKW